MPEFTAQEVITLYLYVMQVEQRLKIKQIHGFANDYFRSWSPRLHSYEAFVVRINRLSEVFKHITSLLLSNNCPAANNFFEKNFNQSNQVTNLPKMFILKPTPMNKSSTNTIFIVYF